MLKCVKTIFINTEWKKSVKIKQLARFKKKNSTQIYEPVQTV